jgi:DNA-binding NarL/FixJ family response regulator
MNEAGPGAAPSRRIRVVVADAAALIREGLAAMLNAQPDVELVGVCADGRELERLIALKRPDVVVTELSLPPTGEREGIRVAARLRESDPEIGVVVLSQDAEPDFATQLLSNGSSRRAYLLKDRIGDADELMRAIAAVREGRSSVDPAVVEALVRARERETHSPLAGLTERERQILGEMAQGKSNGAIAESLVLTKGAVEKHVNSIFAKLDLRQSQSVSRRVKATLLFLADQRGSPPMPS